MGEAGPEPSRGTARGQKERADGPLPSRRDSAGLRAGSCRGIFVTGSSLLGAAIKEPRITSKNLISVIFCEAAAIYGVIVAIILGTKIESSEYTAVEGWNQVRWRAPTMIPDGDADEGRVAVRRR